MHISLGFDEVFDQLHRSVSVIEAQPFTDTNCKRLGDFDALWQFLGTSVGEADASDAIVAMDVESHPDVSSPKQKKQFRKRELRKRKRQLAHEVQEAVPALQDVPDMVDASTATDTDDAYITSSDDELSLDDRLALLRTTLFSATKAYETAHPRRSKRSADDRQLSLHVKLATMFPSEHLTVGTTNSRYTTSVAFQDPPSSKSRTGQTHIFVDSSNIFLGFQDKLQALHPLHYPQHSATKPQMDITILDTILSRGREGVVKALVGSAPLLQSWDDAARRGYEVSILQRVATSEHVGKREQGVDELLHLKMMESLLDTEKPEVMVLATGDANAAQFSSGFFNVVLRALSRGWHVEVWAFRRSVNRLWLDRQFRHEYAAAFSLHFLDEFIEELEA